MKLIPFITIFVTILNVDGIPDSQANKFVKHEKVRFFSEPNLKITGGHPISIRHAPFQVSLEKNYKHHCGGALISNNYILTGAHCLIHIDNKDRVEEIDLVVRAGTSKAEEGGKILWIQLVRILSDFNADPLRNDLGIVKLTEPIVRSERIQPIALKPNLPKPGDIGTVTSYGRQHPKKDNQLKNLMEIKIELYDKPKCEQILRSELYRDVICARNRKGPGLGCFADSGGPMIINGALAGILSGAIGCGLNRMPAIFTAVRYHLDWIIRCVKITRNGTYSC